MHIITVVIWIKIKIVQPHNYESLCTVLIEKIIERRCFQPNRLSSSDRLKGVYEGVLCNRLADFIQSRKSLRKGSHPA